MTDNITYQIDNAKISEQKMQFNIVNRRPKYPAKEKEAVKAEIEKKLFVVFNKYACTD